MGVYNPHIPQILGEEWVPIRNESLTFSPASDAVELGYGFTLNSTKFINDARFNVHEFSSAVPGQYMFASVYPRGQEATTGPIRSVTVPVSAGGVTGSGISLESASAPVDMFKPDGFILEVDYVAPNNPTYAAFFFAMNQYSVLNGKRIVGLNLIYSGWSYNSVSQTPIVDDDPSSPISTVSIRGDVDTGRSYGGFNQINNSPGANSQNQYTNRIAFGEINQMWSTALGSSASDKMPWRYVDLQRFEATNANRLMVRCVFQLPNNGDVLSIDYLALEVLYCEETRVAYGGSAFSFNLGQNVITMRDTSFANNPRLDAGDYTVTLSSADPGDISDGTLKSSTTPLISALRELYEIPTMPGLQVNPTQTLGDTFTKQTTHIIPQISLHTTGGVVVESHVYGRQYAAQVYGALTPLQHIDDDVVSSTSWPQVRYYARRFGSTTVPLTLSSTNITGTGISVSITPAQWDVLDELIDGWKEITLRFPTSPTMGGVTPNPQWKWSATGERAGSRWEVLVASAPAISGVPGNRWNLSPQQLSTGTYNAPNAGSTVLLNWIAPPTSGTADDATSDAVLIFSQDPVTITGVSVTPSSLAVTGFTDCGSGPCCIPTAIGYNQITWPYRPTSVLNDTFTRSVASGWGTADSGQVWTAGVTFSVTGGVGKQSPAVTNTYYIGALGTMSVADVTGSFRVSSATVASGADHWFALTLRGGGSSADQLYVRVGFETNGSITFYLTSVTASVHTTLTTMTLFNTYTVGTWINVAFSLIGNSFDAKAWLDGTPEPNDWLLQATPTANLTAGTIGTRSIVGTGALPTFSVDSIIIADTTLGYVELQRWDSLTDWQTIMQATNPALAVFNDYEARAGVASSYRMRMVNVLGFAGLWSVTGTGTIPEPGVTMPSCGTNKRGVLIFTSNEVQSGTSSLAYAMTWDSNPVEDFSFPEVSGVEITQQFDRDYQVVFHGSERGGETFQRRILLANAAVALPRLGNMHSIRDLAWADLPYVCVRDDIGDRWFASIIVSDGAVKHKRRLYSANLTVIEVTATPSPVNPS